MSLRARNLQAHDEILRLRHNIYDHIDSINEKYHNRVSFQRIIKYYNYFVIICTVFSRLNLKHEKLCLIIYLLYTQFDLIP